MSTLKSYLQKIYDDNSAESTSEVTTQMTPDGKPKFSKKKKGDIEKAADKPEVKAALRDIEQLLQIKQANDVDGEKTGLTDDQKEKLAALVSTIPSECKEKMKALKDKYGAF